MKMWSFSKAKQEMVSDVLKPMEILYKQFIIFTWTYAPFLFIVWETEVGVNLTINTSLLNWDSSKIKKSQISYSEFTVFHLVMTCKQFH